MDRTLILARSVKGTEEISSHKHGLEPALRRTLILVDGHSDLSELQKKVLGDTALEAHIEQLMREGYILARITSSSVNSDDVQDDHINQLKWQLVDLIGEIVGKDYIDRATKKIIASPDSIESLRKTLNDCVKIIKLTIDKTKANELALKGKELLDSAEV